MNRSFMGLLVLMVFGVWACGSDEGDDGAVIVDNIGTGAVPCENGMAGEFPCNGYDLLGRIEHSVFSAGEGNDIWGWTDSTNGKEYALIGLDNGTAFVDISDTDNLIYLGKLPTATTSSIWRDVKIYQDHAFIVSEANGHGMQVFDLTRLRDVADPPQSFSADTRYTDIGNAHNVVINEAVGFAYPVGTARNDAFGGGVAFCGCPKPYFAYWYWWIWRQWIYP